MIVDKQGRTLSVQTPEELEELLRSDLTQMSEEDQEVLLELLEVLGDEEAAPDALDAIHAADYKREVVDIETFVKHPYFLGETCKDLYPVLLRDLQEIFSGDYNEIIYTGSIGLDSLIQETDGGLPTLRERLGVSKPVTVMLDTEQGTSTTEPAHNSGIKPVLRLTLRNGMQLDLTPDHEVRVWRGHDYAWVPAEKLTTDDYVVTPRIVHTEPSSDLDPDAARVIAREDTSTIAESVRDEVCRASNETVRAYLSEVLSSARMERPSLRKRKLRRSKSDPAKQVYQALYTFRYPRERYIRQLQLLLLRFGIRATIRHHPKYEPKRSSREYWEIRINGGTNDIRRCLTLFGVSTRTASDRKNCERFLRYTTDPPEVYRHERLPLTYGDVRELLKETGAKLPRPWPLARSPRTEHRVPWSRVSQLYVRVKGKQRKPLDELATKFYDELSFERVVSIEPRELAVPVGDIGAHNGNRFLANGISVHNSIGFGKTFACSIGVCYVLYQLSCMHSPAITFNLAPETPITVIGLSASEDLAKEVVLKNVIAKIGQSKYFLQKFRPRITQRNIRFPNGVTVWARATTPRSALGMNPVCALVDEIDFMPRRRKKAQQRFGIVNMSKEIYDSITRRIKSRFGRYGKLFLPCSKSTSDSFLARRLKEAESDPTVFARDYALWDAKPGDYSTNKFWVMCGNEQVPSRILPEAEVDAVRADQPERTTLLEVPEDFRSEFESDLEGSIRDLGGVATVSFSPFIQRRHKVYEMEDETRQHPFSTEKYEVGKEGHFLWDEITTEIAGLDADGRVVYTRQPILHPDAPRHIHFDPALNQCSAGMCVAHQFGTTGVKRRNKKMVLYDEDAPLFFIDMILEIVPPIGGELEFAMYRQIVYDFVKHGFPIVSVSMDGYHSLDALQLLANRGYHTSLISMDKTWDPYQHAKSALYENRVKCYHHPELFRQLQKLEADWEKRKISHPEGDLKDVADGFAGALWGAYHMPAYFPLPMLVGNSSFKVPLGKPLEGEGQMKTIPVQLGVSFEAQIANNNLANEVSLDSPAMQFFRRRGLW